MVFVIAAEEMPLKAKSADNIIASFLRIFVLKKKKKKRIFVLACLSTDTSFYVPGKLEACFLLPTKILTLLVMDKA